MKKHHFHAIIISYFLLSLIFITFSSYNFYHGFSEAWYSLQSAHFFITQDYLHPTVYLTGAFTSVPPFFSYLLHISFILFGISDFSARLIPVLSLLLTTISLYYLTKTLYNSSVAQITAIIYLFIPWNILWFHRVMPDTLMIALVTTALYFYVKAYTNNTTMLYFGIITGLAVLAKQPSFIIIPIILIWSYFNNFNTKKVISALSHVLIFSLPFLAWFYLISFNISDMVNTKIPFSNVINTVGIFTIATLPISILAYLQLKKETFKNIFVIWFVLYGIYTLIITPKSHEYYTLPLAVPLSVLASLYISSHQLSLKKVVIASIILSIPLLYVAGSLGYHAHSDVGKFIQQYPDAQIFVQMKYTPQIVWYGNLTFNQFMSIGNQYNQTVIDENSDNKTSLIIVDDKMAVNINKSYPLIYKSQDLSVYRRT